MNRRQRRQARGNDRFAKRFHALQRRVETTGLPGVVRGLTDACLDCSAEGEMILLPGKRAIGRVFHDDGCPAASGATTWEPVPL